MNTFIQAFKAIPLRYIGDLLIYFVLATVIGRYIELVWQFFRYHFDNPAYSLGQLTLPPLAEPYGFGAVVVIAFVVPLAKRCKLGVVKVYILNVLATSLVEYVCAAALVLAFGFNGYWNYSDKFLNIRGYISLETSLLFGVMATLFLYFAYPVCKEKLAHLTRIQFTVAVSVITGLYLLSFVLFKRW